MQEQGRRAGDQDADQFRGQQTAGGHPGQVRGDFNSKVTCKSISPRVGKALESFFNVFVSDLISPCHSPHIHLSSIISFTASRASCPLVVAHVSAPYNRAGLTTVL